ncbi:MAG: peptidyl-prolyl cis-trans isomerase [Candidatus Marinimicrobia bacterium]|nr:peptidyl-prolyl cis-trans isomerase [Candidatus Neomarinimicrobiota bacterium]
MKRLQLILGMILFIVLVIIIVGSRDEKQDYLNTIIVKIDNMNNVNFKEIQDYFYNYHFHRLYKPISKGYYAALDQIISKRLRLIDFIEKDLYYRIRYHSGIKYILNDEFINEYYRRFYYEKYVNDSIAKEYYKDFGKVVYYKQIVLEKEEGMTDEDIDSLRQLAYKIKQDAEYWIDFDDIIERITKNKGKITSSNNLLSINWSDSQFDELKGVIFSSPLNSINVLETKDAFCIVKVYKIKNSKKEPYEKVRKKILNMLSIKYTPIAQKEFENDKSKIVDKNSIVWNKLALEKLVEWSNIPNFYQNAYKDTFKKLINSGNNFVIMKSPRHKVNLKRYLYFISDIIEFRGGDKIEVNEIKNYIIRAVETDILLKRAKNAGIDARIIRPDTKNWVIIDEIAKLYDKEVIEKQIPEPRERELREFFEKNRDSLYYRPARVNIYVVLANDTLKISECKRKIKEGERFERIDRRVYVKRFFRGKDGVVYPEKKGDDINVGKIAFSMKLGEIKGPIEYNDPEKGKMYALIKCVLKVDEKQFIFDEIKEKVKKDYREYLFNKLKKENHERLMTKYNVEVFYNKFQKILKMLKIA